MFHFPVLIGTTPTPAYLFSRDKPSPVQYPVRKIAVPATATVAEIDARFLQAWEYVYCSLIDPTLRLKLPAWILTFWEDMGRMLSSR